MDLLMCAATEVDGSGRANGSAIWSREHEPVGQKRYALSHSHSQQEI